MAQAGTEPGVRDKMRRLYGFDLEREVRDELEGRSDFKRVDEVYGMLTEKGPGLSGPWCDRLEVPLPLRL